MAIGLYLGWLADRTGSIRPAAAAHVANNCAWVLGTALLPRPGPMADVALLVLSLLVAAGATLLLRRRLSPPGRGQEPDPVAAVPPPGPG